MSQVLLDFDFASDLLFDSGLYDFGLVEGLESEDVLGFAFGADHVNSTELSFTEWTAHVEIVEGPFSSGVFPAEETVVRGDSSRISQWHLLVHT